MASPAYLWITDDHGNPIHGDSQVKGRERSIEVFAFDYGVLMPVDKFTGTTTGTRQHETASFTKAFCPASPVLFDAACRGKNLRQVIIKWYQIDANGREQVYFTHQLDDVKVVSFRQKLPHTKDASSDLHVHEDFVELRFGKITLKHHQGNIQASDAWNERS